MTLFFHSDDVDHLIGIAEAVGIAEQALVDLAEGRATNQPRRRLRLRVGADGDIDSRLNVYAGGSTRYGALGAQVALQRASTAGGRRSKLKHHPDQTELALIYDPESGELLAVMAHRPRHVEGSADLRTTATSMVGLERLALSGRVRVGVYGSGHQAHSAFTALCRLREVEAAKVFSPTAAHRERFAERVNDQTGVPVDAVADPREPAEGTDVVLCMTNSNVPVIDGAWLSPGQYIISVVGSDMGVVEGGFLPAPRREIDDETLRRCRRVVALSKQQAIDDRQGDLYWPVEEGVIGWDDVVEIADVLAGRSPGRTEEEDILLFKNQGGQGVIDIALAHRCYELAVETGAGHELDVRPRLGSGTGWRAVH